jgi:hypothetical protein
MNITLERAILEYCNQNIDDYFWDSQVTSFGNGKYEVNGRDKVHIINLQYDGEFIKFSIDRTVDNQRYDLSDEVKGYCIVNYDGFGEYSYVRKISEDTYIAFGDKIELVIKYQFNEFIEIDRKNISKDRLTEVMLLKENARLRRRLYKDNDELLEHIDSEAYGIVDALEPLASAIQLLLQSNNELSALLIGEKA